MELTFIGYALILVGGLAVVAGNLRHALWLMLVSTLFSGSAAIMLPSLGGSSMCGSGFPQRWAVRRASK